MNYVFDPNNCPRKETKLIIDLLRSAGSYREVLELVFHAGQASRDLDRPLDAMQEVVDEAVLILIDVLNEEIHD